MKMLIDEEVDIWDEVREINEKRRRTKQILFPIDQKKVC